MFTYNLSQETLFNLEGGQNTLYRVTKQLKEQLTKVQGIFETLDSCHHAPDESLIALTHFDIDPDRNPCYIVEVIGDTIMDQFLSRFPDCLLGQSQYFIYTTDESLHISFNDSSLDLIYHGTGQW